MKAISEHSGSEAKAPEATRIAGIAAIPPSERDSPVYQLPSVDPVARARLNDAHVEADADRFVRAGWSFVGNAPPPGSALGVYKLGNGHLCLAGRALNIKFAPDASSSDIAALLDKHSLRKRRHFGFARNMMMVEVERPGQLDPFAISRDLVDDPRILSAEPVIVEQIGPR